jgi:putative transposase
MLIREAFFGGISTRQVGRVGAIITQDAVSAQTVSTLSQGLDRLVKAFREAKLSDEWVYLFWDGVSWRVRRPAGRKRVQMLAAYGIRADGHRPWLGFVRSQGESQAAWEGWLQDLFRRGLEGKHRKLIVRDGCEGRAAAIQTVYPHAEHQRCWVHKMRNILEHVRKRDDDAVKIDAPAIYRAENRKAARAAFRAFRTGWRDLYPARVKRLERDRPELLSFYSFPKHLWRSLRTPPRDRAWLGRGSPKDATDGLLRECRQRGSDYFLDL